MSRPTTVAAAVEPVPIRVTRYRCPFCARSRSARAATVEHIARCWSNPAVRGCKTCAHDGLPEEGPYPEHPGWPEDCAEGRDISTGLMTGCPLWQPSEGDR